MYIAVYLRYYVSLFVNINIVYMTPQRATWKNSYYTGGVQIIGRNSRFVGYFVTKTKKNTEKIPEDSRLTQALSDSILFVSKFKVKIEEIRRSLTPPFAVLSAHIALYYRKQCFYERKA